MSGFLVILILFLIAVAGGVVIYYQSKKAEKIFEKKIHELEEIISTLKIDLDKKTSVMGQMQQKNQFDTFAGQIVSKINQGIIVIDQNRVIRLVNNYAENYLDIVPAVGKNYQEAINVQIIGNRDYSSFEIALTGKTQELPDNIEIVSKRGKTPITGTITPIEFSNLKIIVFVFFDSTKSKSSIEEEKAFFSEAAHELRAPLTTMRLTLALLLDKFDTYNREKVMEYLKKANDETDRMAKLVNNFLNVSRIEQGRLAIDNKPFNIVSLTEDVIKEFLLQARERKLYLNHAEVQGVYRDVVGDPIRAREVLTNLISNSIKYTIQGGITVSHVVTDNSLITKISDTGVGIPKESQVLLFKRFSQVGMSRTQTTGKSTGLGLYISKEMAKLMHGDVILESSEPGNGSTFTFTLPLAPNNS